MNEKKENCTKQEEIGEGEGKNQIMECEERRRRRKQSS